MHDRHLQTTLENIRKPETQRSDSRENHSSRLADNFEKNELETVYFRGDLGTLLGNNTFNLFQEGLHLPNGLAIASYYIENHGASAILTVSHGSAPTNGDVTIKPGIGKRLPCPNHVTSISIVSNTQNDTGLVLVCLSTRLWSPASNTSI